MKCESKRFVGFWHYGVVLTYLSVVSAVGDRNLLFDRRK